MAKIYKDDILDTSVNTRRRYNLIQNNDGTVSFEDVTVYSQVGDNFGAGDINNILNRMFASDGAEFRFGVNEKGEYGYIVEVDGADTVIPFKRAFGNATQADVLAGKTFTNADGVEYTGTFDKYWKYITYKTHSTSATDASIDVYIYNDVLWSNQHYTEGAPGIAGMLGLATLGYSNLKWTLTFLKNVTVNGTNYNSGSSITWGYAEEKEFEVVLIE